MKLLEAFDESIPSYIKNLLTSSLTHRWGGQFKFLNLHSEDWSNIKFIKYDNSHKDKVLKEFEAGKLLIFAKYKNVPIMIGYSTSSEKNFSYTAYKNSIEVDTSQPITKLLDNCTDIYYAYMRYFDRANISSRRQNNRKGSIFRNDAGKELYNAEYGYDITPKKDASGYYYDPHRVIKKAFMSDPDNNELYRNKAQKVVEFISKVSKQLLNNPIYEKNYDTIRYESREAKSNYRKLLKSLEAIKSSTGSKRNDAINDSLEYLSLILETYEYFSNTYNIKI